MTPTLRLGFCSHDAALFAVRAWHYSRTLPAGKAVRIDARDALEEEFEEMERKAVERVR